MAESNSRGTKTTTKIFSAIFFVICLVILAMIGISLGKETYKKKQVQKEIESLQSEIEKTRIENRELNDLLSYLNTQDFQEKEAREKLNLQKEDEKMIVLRKDNSVIQHTAATETDSRDASQQDDSPNWMLWFKYFFDKV